MRNLAAMLIMSMAVLRRGEEFRFSAEDTIVLPLARLAKLALALVGG
jgi:hypothetical protein